MSGVRKAAQSHTDDHYTSARREFRRSNTADAKRKALAPMMDRCENACGAIVVRAGHERDRWPARTHLTIHTFACRRFRRISGWTQPKKSPERPCATAKPSAKFAPLARRASPNRSSVKISRRRLSAWKLWRPGKSWHVRVRLQDHVSAFTQSIQSAGNLLS